MEKTLNQLEEQKEAKIIEIKGGVSFNKKLAELNIRVGKNIKKLASQPFMGPVVVEIGNTEITLGRGMAGKIYVEEI
ncbi:ferrous iron transport protein A [Candidatus Falkowbacteria bacterium]|nr:MAG: ferrous iron transport protein A [Candidatus Falkowbacteria bacterium]